MSTLAERLPWLKSRLDELVVAHDVPGVAVAVLDDRRDEIVESASGVTSVETGLAATPDTFFALWSISKVYTTTLVMQLVDQGVVELDSPVVRYVPDFRPGDSPERAISVRQLLTHTSGLRWDTQQDFGRGDDCVARCTAAMTTEPIPPPGTLFSYCNAGFAVAGAVIERVTGEVWDTALHTRLLEPLDLRNSLTLPEDLLQRRVAAQHRPDPATGTQALHLMWPMPRAYGPAGTTLHVTAQDLLGFARLHLRGGTAPDGTRLLSVESVRAMQAQQVDLPVAGSTGSERNDGWGLGWARFSVDGMPAVGHSGGSSNVLRLFPLEGLAIAVLSNGMRGSEIAEAVITEALAHLLDIQPTTATPAQPAADLALNLADYTGRYAGTDLSMDILVSGDGLIARSAESEAWGPVLEFPLRMVDRTVFEIDGAGRGAFLEFNGAAPRFLHLALRTMGRQ